MNKKYELTSEFKLHFGVKLFRIKALMNFSFVKKGDLGGFIQKENNLSQCDDAWVRDDAVVRDDAWVRDDAVVRDRAVVRDDAVVCDDAWVRDDAVVRDRAWVRDDAVVRDDASKNPVFISGLKYNVTITDKSMIIGCQSKSIKQWSSITEKTFNGSNEDRKLWKLWKPLLSRIIKLSGRS